MQSFRKYVKYILLALVVASPIGIKLVIGEWAQIPSSSMSPTLLPNDWLWYNKYEYGTILPKRISEIPVINLFCLIPHIQELDRKISWQAHRLKGPSIPRHMDIIVFQSPENQEQLLVKRCIGLPGDTLYIRKGQVYINRLPIVEKGGRLPCHKPTPILFPAAMKSKWTSNEYGPIIIPYNGMNISLDSQNIKLYAETINIENKAHTMNQQYTFKNNYYFMMGDNRGNSLDSRYIGFIPEQNISGKAVMVLFSKRTSEKEKHLFRMDRFLKKLE